MPTEMIRTVSIMQETSSKYRTEGKRIGFVPTMGALHEGHMSLIRRARQDNDVVVVSIFVNPRQFAVGEDLDSYPGDYAADWAMLLSAGVEVLFMPSVSEMYPGSFCTTVSVTGITDRLCGKFRPTHFAGVTTVVAKLFSIVRPTMAYFGQKDYQQCVVISRLVCDLNMAIQVVQCPTVREKDGLAMSSRNVYLTPQERADAPLIYGSMKEVEEGLKRGTLPLQKASRGLTELLRGINSVNEVQYASVYDPESLVELTGIIPGGGGGKNGRGTVLIAVAVKMGTTRLIDNLLVQL
ncbi:pantothenate synthetase [Candidatus Magnetobacterium bavaricum]|uniref:Pantothenate synthetase n=1 Tax=Candidatus Magnetobacterium bavaricum TaxID=29290 RepID=A0A0F3GX97_9BACT|nr:pantothenate synthetase [Candidatus Magnetobacterium bavaricum]